MSIRTVFQLLVSAMIIIVAAVPSYANDTLFVHPVAVMGGSGQSWASPLRTLSAALELATTADEIWVARGDYYVSETIAMKSGVAIYGGFYGDETMREIRDWYRHPVRINAVDLGVIMECKDLDSSARIDGLIFKGASQHAMKITASTPKVYNCHFTENTGTQGAAVYISNSGRVRFEYCLFTNNKATDGGGAVLYENGVDPLNYGVTVFFGQCGFFNNEAKGDGGAVRIAGVVGVPQFSSCVFYKNNAGNNGGALATKRGFVYVTNSTFAGNNVTNGSGRSVAMAGGHVQNSIMWNGDEEDTVRHFAIDINLGDTTKLTSTANLVEQDFDLGFYQNDPQFFDMANPAGADGFFGTDDDGLRLSESSTARDAGVIDRFVNHRTTDAIGNARLVGRKVDLGAYETERPGHDQYEAIVDELRTGKMVLLFRHMKTDWSSQEKGPSPECFPGRNLNIEGRDQSVSVGKFIRSLGIQIGDVPSSPVCRCWESNLLMHGRVDKVALWASGADPASMLKRTTEISTMPKNGVKSIITHDAVIVPLLTDSNVTSAEVMEGDAMVIRPLGTDFFVVGHFCSDTWERYHVRFSNIPAAVQETEIGSSMSATITPNPFYGDEFTVGTASVVNGERVVRIVSISGEQSLVSSRFTAGIATLNVPFLGAGIYAVAIQDGTNTFRAMICKAP